MTSFLFLVVLAISRPPLTSVLENQAANSSPADLARAEAISIFNNAVARYITDHDAAAARASFEASLNRDPTYALPLYNLGLLAEIDGDWTQAQMWLLRFLALDAESPYAQRAKREIPRISAIVEMDKTPAGHQMRLYDEAIIHSEVLSQLGFPQEGMTEAATAAKLDPGRWEAYAAAAFALSKNKRFQEAEVYLRQAKARAPSEKQAELQEALETCQKEERYQALTLQGSTALKAGMYSQAVSTFAAAGVLFPNRGKSALAYGFSLAMAGRYQDSAGVFTALRSSSDAQIAQQARSSLAKLALRGVVTIPLTDADRHAATASAAAEQGDFPDAEQEYRLALKTEPSNPIWHGKLASILAQQQRWADAEIEYRMEFILDPSDQEAISNVGATLLQENKGAEAVEAYQTAVRLNPGSAQNHDNLGTSWYLSQHPTEAVSEYKEAVKLDPSNQSYRSHLSEAMQSGPAH